MTPNGLKGTSEKALIGTLAKDAENPVELGRIIRSFDPCVSCANARLFVWETQKKR